MEDEQPLNFPGTTGSGEAFLIQLSPDGQTVEAGSRFGTSDGYGNTSFVAVDSEDNAYASGEIDQISGTFSPTGFQPTPSAQLSMPCSPSVGSFLIESASNGTVLYASYLRRTGTIFVTAPGHLLIDSTSGAVSLDLTSIPAMNFQCPVNSASYTVPAVGGEIVSLFGYGLGPLAGVSAQPDSSGRYPTSLAGVQVQINGVPAPLLYVQAGQVNTVVPNNQHPSDFLYTVEVSYQDQSAPLLDVYGQQANPGVFAVLNRDSTLNSPMNPAKPGSIVSVYATGMNVFDLNFPDGVVTPLSPLLPSTSLDGNAVLFDGVATAILWEGAAPGVIFGVEQINVQLPASLSTSVVTSVPMVVQSSYEFVSPAFAVFVAP